MRVALEQGDGKLCKSIRGRKYMRNNVNCKTR